MKINFSTFVCAYVTFIVSYQSYALQITHCYFCTGKLNDCNDNINKTKCMDSTRTSSSIAESTTVSSGGEPLLEREDGDTEKYTGPTLPSAIPDGRIPVLAWKCLTVTGKNEKSGDVMMWKGCGYSCDTTIITPIRTTFPIDDQCEDCDNKDYCNSSTRINATIRWMFSMVLMPMWVLTISNPQKGAY